VNPAELMAPVRGCYRSTFYRFLKKRSLVVKLTVPEMNKSFSKQNLYDFSVLPITYCFIAQTLTKHIKGIPLT